MRHLYYLFYLLYLGESLNKRSILPHERMLAFLFFAGDNSTFHNQQWSHGLSDSAINESIMIAKRVFKDNLFDKYLYPQTQADAKKEAELFARKDMFDLNEHGQLEYNFPKIIQLSVDGCHVNCK